MVMRWPRFSEQAKRLLVVAVPRAVDRDVDFDGLGRLGRVVRLLSLDIRQPLRDGEQPRVAHAPFAHQPGVVGPFRHVGGDGDLETPFLARRLACAVMPG